VRQRRGRLKHAKHETALVIIDHMGKIKPASRYAGNKTAEVGEISGALTAMAKNLDVALVTLCQLNRGAEAQENKRPGLQNLRDSGEIEQDADLVLFLYRPSYYLERARENSADAEHDRKEVLEACRHDFEVIIGKQRNGPCITVDLWADMANNAIRNKAR
jgi:replicative DNA helicase